MLKMKILCLLSCIVMSLADKESLITNETGSTDSEICSKDEGIAKICLQCSLLSFYATPSLETCCSDESAFLLCEACVNDKDSCETLMNELEAIDTLAEDDEDYFDGSRRGQDSGEENYPDSQAVDKRYGRLFVNRNPKRYGKIFFGKRSGQAADDNMDEMEKRYGRIFFGGGSYFGKRSEMDKRYGRLFTNSKSYFGKRSEPNGDLAQAFGDEQDDLEVAKRYGRVYMGSRRNKLYGKRYGRIFFGKRSNDDMDKRFGTLHMNKRFGRLFTGRRKYYFGK
ncbi:uncharacterized protein LOC132719945 [Ruditapes philippinarum]|uniref:uncharacterized protein LOC132719945 n=1 Tax=Ruditapes philippinarum TaxID=129788 RepID=UPI00295C088F|nr:uncharacterized protein LOC132719945 [Ruditapes philippinarum]